MKNEKTMQELICDVANISDEAASQLPHWARVLRDLCRKVIAESSATTQDAGAAANLCRIANPLNSDSTTLNKTANTASEGERKHV